MIFSLVVMTGLEKWCITSAYLQWQCHSGERPVACGPLVLQCARNLFIGGKFEELLWENLNKVLSVSPQKKTGKLIKIPEIKYKIYQ